MRRVFPIVMAAGVFGGAEAKAAAKDLGALPPNPKPGECYVRVKAPPAYKVVKEQVLVEPAGQRVEIIPGETRSVEKKIMVKPETSRYEFVPPKFEKRQRKVEVVPERTRLVQVPAQYKTVQEKVLIKPEEFAWKRGTDPLRQVNNTSGDIMCLVKVPAQYRTIPKSVLVSEATVREEKIPAQFATYEEVVMVEPAKTRELKVPPEYRNIKVEEVVREDKQRVIPIEPRYATVERLVKTSAAQMVWKRVLCRTNINHHSISVIQRALSRKGYEVGSIDGRLSRATLEAISKYQNDNNLAQGELTYEFLEHIGAV